jgi:nucleoid DNA-binding protein
MDNSDFEEIEVRTRRIRNAVNDITDEVTNRVLGCKRNELTNVGALQVHNLTAPKAHSAWPS